MQTVANGSVRGTDILSSGLRVPRPAFCLPLAAVCIFALAACSGDSNNGTQGNGNALANNVSSESKDKPGRWDSMIEHGKHAVEAGKKYTALFLDIAGDAKQITADKVSAWLDKRDANGDGALSMTELGPHAWLLDDGSKSSIPAKIAEMREAAADRLHFADRDSDGAVTLEEFVNHSIKWETLLAKGERAFAVEGFDFIDKNNDGKLDAKETSYRPGIMNWDNDGDGAVSRDEWKAHAEALASALGAPRAANTPPARGDK